MKIHVLIDNKTVTDLDFATEPALSLYFEHNGKSFLFDTGYSDTFIQNAEKMKIDLASLDYIVLSHGHYDHSQGLSKLAAPLAKASAQNPNLRKPTLVAHPYAIEPKRFKEALIGCNMSKSDIACAFDLRLSKTPLWLSDDVVFLGEIPRKTNFEAQTPIGEACIEGQWTPDYVSDDSAMVVKLQDGIVIVTGCSHAGICNMISYAKKITGEDRIVEIIGGLHLENPTPEQLKSTVMFMRDIRAKRVHACHCTGLKAQIELAKAGVNIEDAGAGLMIEVA
ncbi:MAG: MBL fold metallo-hydrolase [Alphaproteobacteria bacterium]|nr:MBL fold metallo-hydrolase [Alphaproteobacteria bacterium]